MAGFKPTKLLTPSARFDSTEHVDLSLGDSLPGGRSAARAGGAGAERRWRESWQLEGQGPRGDLRCRSGSGSATGPKPWNLAGWGLVLRSEILDLQSRLCQRQPQSEVQRRQWPTRLRNCGAAGLHGH